MNNTSELIHFDTKKLMMLPMSQLELNNGQLEGYPKNPRKIKKDKFDKLKQNIEKYPEMLAWRSLLVYPLADDRYIIIGGNMRYRAMQDLGHKDAPCFVIPRETTVDRLQAYTILDNNGFGEWDWDLLANEWSEDMLEDWGLDVDFDEGEATEDNYTRKVISPVYEPSGNKPSFGEMVDTSKCEELIDEINKANLPEDIAQFLREASHRHTVFNYQKIADFYAQADAETQSLMERSALVIIDFDKAIEYGYVQLTSQLAGAYKTERDIDEDAITEDEMNCDYDA